MALTKSTSAATTPTSTPATQMAPTTSVGSFETMDETTTETPAANDAISGAAVDVAPTAKLPAVAATTAVAKAEQDQAKSFSREVADMKGAADFRYGNYKVFKGNNGEIMETGGGSAKLGRWVNVTMMAWDDHYEISPGSQSPKSKEAVGYSKDGITMDSIIGVETYGRFVNGPVDDYVAFLKTDGDYPMAKKARFIDIACIVNSADSEDAFNGEIIQITLSQSSIPSFASYQETLIMKAKAAARGIKGVKISEDPFTFHFLREVTTKGDNTWTKLKVVTTLPTKL